MKNVPDSIAADNSAGCHGNTGESAATDSVRNTMQTSLSSGYERFVHLLRHETSFHDPVVRHKAKCET